MHPIIHGTRRADEMSTSLAGVPSPTAGRALDHVHVATLYGESDGEGEVPLRVWVAPRVVVVAKQWV